MTRTEYPREEEADANARLIAAAPELLEALRGTLSALAAMPSDYQAQPYVASRIMEARRAVAKAEGADDVR